MSVPTATPEAQPTGGEPRKVSTAGKVLAVAILVVLAVGAWFAFTGGGKSKSQAATPPAAVTGDADLAAAAISAQTAQAQWWALHKSWDGYAPAPTGTTHVVIGFVAGGDYLLSAVTEPGAATCKMWSVSAGVPSAPADAPAATCSQAVVSRTVAASTHSGQVQYLNLTPSGSAAK